MANASSSVAFWGLVAMVAASLYVVLSCLGNKKPRGELHESFASPRPADSQPASESANIRIADEIAMQRGLTTTGSKIVVSNATSQCTVRGVAVHEMEVNTSRDPQITSCIVSRSLLKPLQRSLTGDVAKNAAVLEDMLKHGPAIASAYCRPQSTLCTVEFKKDASVASLEQYNAYLTSTFGFSSSTVANVAHSGTMYTMMPESAHKMVPKRMTIKVDDNGDKHFLVYKYCGKASSENPLDLWRSSGRNVDNDMALNATDSTTSYCSDMLAELAWEAFQFAHVVVEVRRGPDTISAFKFRATKDRMQWFHPTQLVTAYFGNDLEEAPPDFNARRFARFSMEDKGGDRLYWTIVDDIQGSSSSSSSRNPTCTTESVFFLCAPYRATSCTLLERAHGRIIAATSEDPTSLERDAPATHLCVWLAVPADPDTSSGKRAGTASYEPSPSFQIAPSMMAQAPPPNLFESKAKKPTKDLPCVLGEYSGGASPWCAASGGAAGGYAWDVPLREMRPYSQEELGEQIQTINATATLVAVNIVRFHKSYRVVLIGEGRDFSTDAAYVAVLQDNKIMASYGYPPGPASGAVPNVRHVDGRTARIALSGAAADNDGSFLDACLTGEWEGSTRSIIIEKVTDVPLQASRKCIQSFSAAHEVLMHIGSYDSNVGNSDLMGNEFNITALRSFHVGKGYVATLYDAAGFKGSPIGVHKGPVSRCLQDGEVVRSIRVMHSSQHHE